jgi:hypothetical protein
MTPAESDDITEGQLNDIKAGRGWVYVRVWITYGEYHSGICTQYAVRAHPSIANYFEITNTVLCEDHKTNDAN